VRHVVLGSMRHEGARIRLKLALVDGESGSQTWAESFVAEREELPASLAELAIRLGRALQPALYRSTVQRRAAFSAQEVSADDLAMRAYALWFQGFNAENIKEALAFCERAVSLDPGSVRGWWAMTFMNLQAISNRWVPDLGAAARRIDEAAAHLDRLVPDGHEICQAKVIQAYLGKQWPTMLRLARTWTERIRHPVAFGTVGIAALLNGRIDEAVEVLEVALRLSPRDPIRAEWQYRLAMAHFAASRYELADEWAETAVDANPTLPWPPIHAAALQLLGRHEEARQALAAFDKRHPGFETERILERLPSDNPILAEARERLIAALDAIRGGEAASSRSRARRPRGRGGSAPRSRG
jgi:tetratricopeptide (TPR) repeat protein